VENILRQARSAKVGRGIFRKRAARCHELLTRTRRWLHKELRAGGWLCFQNEFSDVVWSV